LGERIKLLKNLTLIKKTLNQFDEIEEKLKAINLDVINQAQNITAKTAALVTEINNVVKKHGWDIVTDLNNFFTTQGIQVERYWIIKSNNIVKIKFDVILSDVKAYLLAKIKSYIEEINPFLAEIYKNFMDDDKIGEVEIEVQDENKLEIGYINPENLYIEEEINLKYKKEFVVKTLNLNIYFKIYDMNETADNYHKHIMHPFSVLIKNPRERFGGEIYLKDIITYQLNPGGSDMTIFSKTSEIHQGLKKGQKFNRNLLQQFQGRKIFIHKHAQDFTLQIFETDPLMKKIFGGLYFFMTILDKIDDIVLDIVAFFKPELKISKEFIKGVVSIMRITTRLTKELNEHDLLIYTFQTTLDPIPGTEKIIIHEAVNAKVKYQLKG
jgi:hypothetical protein